MPGFATSLWRWFFRLPIVASRLEGLCSEVGGGAEASCFRCHGAARGLSGRVGVSDGGGSSRSSGWETETDWGRGGVAPRSGGSRLSLRAGLGRGEQVWPSLPTHIHTCAHAHAHTTREVQCTRAVHGMLCAPPYGCPRLVANLSDVGTFRSLPGDMSDLSSGCRDGGSSRAGSGTSHVTLSPSLHVGRL